MNYSEKMVQGKEAIEPPIAREQLAIYRETAQQNWQNSQIERQKRREKAWQLARLAANLLREKFGANRVIVFGSLLDRDRFTLWSDVDIAAWGILPQDTFQAMGEVRELDDSIEMNLVDTGACQPSLLEQILREGKEIC
jgi:uncharacterized protein